MFKRLTEQQRSVYNALRELGEMVINYDDARSVAVLKRRGLVRYRRDQDGVRYAILRETAGERRVQRRTERAAREFSMYCLTRARLHEDHGA